jgi:ferric-chelate reductase (NADPH)
MLDKAQYETNIVLDDLILRPHHGPGERKSKAETELTMNQAKSPGRMEGALTRLFTKSASVRELRLIEGEFNLVTLSGESLKGIEWTPGDKLQVALGGWAFRTYTPLSWDRDSGVTQLLVYLHGDAPGAVWGRSLEVGDDCALVGPRASIDLNALARPALLVGDETSFALAHALRSTRRGTAAAHLLFEVNAKQLSERVLQQLGISDAEVIERTPDESHLRELEALAVAKLSAASVQGCVLSGKAATIQRLNKRLRAVGLASRQVRTRAYWAPGKVGLD